MDIERIKKKGQSLIDYLSEKKDMEPFLQNHFLKEDESQLKDGLEEIAQDVKRTSPYLAGVIYYFTESLVVKGDMQDCECGNIDAVRGLVYAFQAILASYDWWRYVHPEITALSKRLYEDGHYAESVTKAWSHINERLQEKYKECRNAKKAPDGDNLINQVFSENNPVLRFSSPNPESAKDVQSGGRDMLKGAWAALRNPGAHHNIGISPEEALRRLMFASMLLYMIDDAKPPKT